MKKKKTCLTIWNEAAYHGQLGSIKVLLENGADSNDLDVRLLIF